MTTSPLSDAIAVDLKTYGMRFIGTTIVYAYLQSIGVINAHEPGCFLVVPEFLRTLVFARPRGDDQFADCTFSPSLDMSR